ncbi:MAG: PAS domain S-box protein [Nitrospirae bacterium]|nr:PAS domain S-box protein [Nitrospirota bacterium]
MKPVRITVSFAIAAILCLPVYILFVFSPAVTRLIEKNAREEALSVATHLTGMLLRDNVVPGRDLLPADFSAEVETVRKDFRIIMVKVYSSAGEVIYSSDPSFLGQVNREDYFRNTVANGKVYSSIVRQKTKTLEGQTADIDVAETYVPLMNAGVFSGAFEIYYDVSDRINNLNGVMSHAYAILFAVVTLLLAVAGSALNRAVKSMKERDMARKEWENTFDAVTDPIMILDREFRMLRVNRAMGQLLDVAPEKAVGMTCYRHIHCTEEPLADCPHRKLLQDRKVHTEEVYEARTDTHHAVTVFPIFDENGDLAASVHYAKDITMSKKAEQELLNAEAKYRIVADNAYAWEFWMAPDGRYIYTSPSCMRITGYQPDEFTSDSGLLLRIIHPEDQERVAAHQATAQNQATADEIQFRIVCRDGTIRWMSHVCQPIYDEQGKHLGVRGSNYDISGRKETEAALRESEKLLRTIVESEPECVTLLSREGAIIMMNPAGLAMLDAESLDAVRGHNISALVNPEYREPFRGLLGDVFLGRSGKLEFEVTGFKGRQCWFDTHAVPLRNDRDEIIALLGITRDITERKRSEEATERQLKFVTALTDIGMAISSSLDMRVTLNILLDRLTSQLGVDAADVMLLDQDTLYLSCAAALGFETSAIRKISLRIGMGHAGRAAMERRTLIITDLGDTLTHSLRGEGFISYIAVPLISQGKIKGVLEIFQRQHFEPSDEWLGYLELISAHASIAIDNASMFDSLQRSNMELTLSYDATLEGWGRTLEFRDEDTMGHTARVAGMTVRFARKMGLEEREIVHVRRGALLHDIGKIGISDNILLKPGRLSDGEREIMQRHPDYAYRLLSPIPFLRPSLDIPYCHHEKWDGTGYPRGLKGEEIPLSARIFSVVDVWDALLSARSYREAWPLEKVKEYIRSRSGSEFDPAVVDCFMKILDEQGPDEITNQIDEGNILHAINCNYDNYCI